MRFKYLFVLTIIFSLSNCSSDGSDENETEMDIIRCFTVKEINTDIRIANARVILNTFVCGAGCGNVMLGNELTNSNGEVCFNLTESENEDILQITCTAEGYQDFEINSPDLNFTEIFLEPN